MIREISRRLGKRSLYWFGIRGDDARSLADIPQFAGSFSIINRYSSQPLAYMQAYEDYEDYKVRDDLDTWDIDNHLTDPVTKQFRNLIMGALGREDSAVTTYRPSQFLSAITFARQDRCQYLGMYAEQQHAFEHKPWIETAVRASGLPMVNWHYIADEEQLQTLQLLSRGPVVLRPSRGSGGVGMTLVDAPQPVDSLWPSSDEFFVSVSSYLANCLPMNVGAVVWDDGVTIHHPSVQLIGLQCSTTRPFGYCGNDFGLVRELDLKVIDQIEAQTIQVGAWLQKQGYRGAFGLDFLLDHGTVRFTEVNPRFQGSTRTSSRLDALADRPCLLLDHVAALLHLPAPAHPRVRDLLTSDDSTSQIVLHNMSNSPVTVPTEGLTAVIDRLMDTAHAEIVAPPGVAIQPNATVAVFRFSHSITATGYEVDSRVADAMGLVAAATKGVST